MSQNQVLEMPSFDFSAPIMVSDAEAKELMKFDRLEPNAEYILEIVKAEWKGVSDKDSAWGKFNFIFALPGTVMVSEGGKDVPKSPDGKRAPAIYHNQMVPLTSKNLFNEETSPLQADRFVKFCQAFGIEASIGNYAAASKAFAKWSDFKGKRAKCLVGYTRDHIGYADDKYFIADKTGKPMKNIPNNSFTSRDAALGAAVKYGLDDIDKAFLNIKKMSSIEEQQTSAAEAAVLAEVDEEY